MRLPFILLISLFISGCLATSKHVDKGDVLLYKVAKEANVTPVLQAEIKTHIKEGSAPQLPDIPSGSPLEALLAGSGGIAGILYGLYKAYQSKQSDKLANKLAFLDKDESLVELKKAKKI